MDDERKIEAHGSQIGGIGDDWHVEGGIHFHGPSLPQSLHQIPDPPRYFKGREKEIDELVAAARETGAIISGLGGIGKTTLAYKLAHELAGDYPDAQLLVGLNGTSASPLFAADAMGQIIHAFHPQADLPASQSKRSGLYRSVLHGKRAVLLLDDAADADQIEPLVPPASCALIITSRTRFQIPGMHALNLGMLGKEEARMLLLEISPRVHDYADEIAELCGYLPLALEIAASAMAERVDLAPAEYTRRLRDERKRLDLVDASLSLSYDLLDERLQRLWARLSVFSIPFEREAAAAVWELELDAAVDHLGQLLRYSLIDWRENVGRYDFHDLARIFAYQKLQEIEDPRSIHRLAAAYFETKITDEESEVTASEVLEAIDQWERAEDWEQFAWRCARLARGFHRVGSWEEITDRLERALRAVRERLDNPGLETALLNELGTITWKKGEWDKAIDIFEENLKILEQLGDVHGKGHTWGALGNIYVDKREWAQAMDMYRKSLSALEQVDDRWGLAQGWGNLGNAYALKREWEQAIREYRRSLAMKRSLGDLRGIADTLLNLGNIDFERRDWDRATEIYEEALEIFQHLGVLQSVAHALASLGRVCVQKDEWNRATEVLEQSLEIYEQVGDAHGIATVRGVLGTLHAEKRE
jgi:tetratricopeptide (TPR) repeat protein